METRATYYDGLRAFAQDVRISLEGEVLVIRAEDGRQIDCWPTAEIHRSESFAAKDAVKLRRGFARDDRLIVHSDDLDWLAAACSNLTKRRDGGAFWRPVVIWAAVAVVSVVLLVTVLIPLFAQQAAQAFPSELERRLGDRIAEQVIAAVTFRQAQAEDLAVCQGVGGQRALDAMAARLAAGLNETVALRVRVVHSRRVNALALPGGHILVRAGLLGFAEDGDEVAGVLAHEIAHVALRHPLEITIKRASVSLLIGVLLGDVAGGSMLAGLGQALIGAAYSREAELEADTLGAELMTRAGYDPTALSIFLERLEEKQGDRGGVVGFFSTHPAIAERSQTIRHSPDGGAIVEESDWRAIRVICDS